MEMHVREIEQGATPKILRRKLNEITRAAAWTMGSHWHKNLLAKHFTAAGAREYGYAARQGEPGRPGKNFRSTYTGRKLREHGHTRPLEFTGDSRHDAETQVSIDAVATKGQGRVRVKMNAPGFNRRYKGSVIDMRAEVTRISARDSDELTDVGGDDLKRRFKSISDRTQTTVA